MVRLKVQGIYLMFFLLFAAVAAMMLAVLTAAFVCVPTGIFAAVLGGVLMSFDLPFIVTELSPVLMVFGGLFAASTALFLAFAAIKAGMAVSRLFLAVRRYCDRLRGW